jgi:small-conductance mechanosensitive channel
LAVALALQDTLGNFFGGVHILVDKPFREEDYVKMDNGIEGVIKQIGWRTTKINTFPTNNLIIVPNSKIANSILENFSYPNEKTGIVQTIGVDYKEDVEQVETILLDTLLKTAEKTNGIIDKESVWVRFDSFGDFSLNFKYGYLVNDWSNKGSASRSTNKAIFYAFKENNINIPFPVRTIHNPINITKVEEQKKTKK